MHQHQFGAGGGGVVEIETDKQTDRNGGGEASMPADRHSEGGDIDTGRRLID